MAGNVHRPREALARAVGDATGQVTARREGDRMQHEIQPPPRAGDGIEHRLHLAGLLHVQRQGDRRIHQPRQRLHMRPGLVVEPGHREFRPRVAEGAGAAPGDALVIGDADDQAALAVQVQ